MGNHILKSSSIRDVGEFTDLTEEERKKMSYKGFTQEELDTMLLDSPPRTYKNSMRKNSKIMSMPSSTKNKNINE